MARFHFRLEPELCQLEDELKSGSYQPGPYFTFRIFDPKERLISAAPYRDRVVHHALCQVLEPTFERVFIFDSYASRQGKGTHAALDRFTAFARRNRYVLKCDVQKYFPSMDHQILKGLLARKVKDPNVLRLVNLLVDRSNPQEEVRGWFPGDDLFSPLERRRGLPIGNQTSQFFANVYLDPLDHWVKETVRARYYLRYMDDFVIFSNDKGWLAEVREGCRAYLETVRLRMHPDKSAISRVQDGTRFLGLGVFPDRRRLPWANVVRMKRRLRRMQAAYAAGRMAWRDIHCRIMSWIGHARQADSYRLRERLFEEVVFKRQAG